MSDLHRVKVLSKKGNKVQLEVTIVHPDERNVNADHNFALQLILQFYGKPNRQYVPNEGEWEFYPFTKEGDGKLVNEENRQVLLHLLEKMYWREIPISKEEYEERLISNDGTYNGEKSCGLNFYDNHYFVCLETEYDAFCTLAEEHIELVELLEVRHYPHWQDRVETWIRHEQTHYNFEDEVCDLYENEPNPSYILQITLNPKSEFLLNNLLEGFSCSSTCFNFEHYKTNFVATKKPISYALMYSSEVEIPTDEELQNWWNNLVPEWRQAFWMNLAIQKNWLYPQIHARFSTSYFKPTFEEIFGKSLSDSLLERVPTLNELQLMSRLKILYTGEFNFTDLEPIRILRDLRLFYSEATPFENVDALEEMTHLEDVCLIVYGAKPNLSWLAKLSELRKLYVDFYQPEHIQLLSNKPKLKELTLFSEVEFDPDVLLHLPELKKLTVSYPNTTGIPEPSIQKIVQELRNKGIQVQWDSEFMQDEQYEMINY
ncbi:MAG: hypothetical protein RL264_642 [Bacteroidota bacterium]|jgi:hypothetical protein